MIDQEIQFFFFLKRKLSFNIFLQYHLEMTGFRWMTEWLTLVHLERSWVVRFKAERGFWSSSVTRLPAWPRSSLFLHGGSSCLLALMTLECSVGPMLQPACHLWWGEGNGLEERPRPGITCCQGSPATAAWKEFQHKVIPMPPAYWLC